MQVKVTFRNTDVKDDVRKRAEEKVLKIKKFMTTPIQVSFIFSQDKLKHFAELTVTGDGAHLTSSVSASDYFAAIDDSVEKIIIQLKKYKDKMHTKKGGKKASDIVGEE